MIVTPKLIRSGEGTFIVTVQLLEPETETLRLYRSPNTWPTDSDALQPPPPPPLDVVVGAPVVGETYHRVRKALLAD